MPITAESSTEAQAVRNSRAGDTFHYRWAARRCLALIQPNSSLKCVKIEGSNQPERPGECAIDVAEYYEKDGIQTVIYHQLKHSTVRSEREFTFSELKPTFRQFAARFTANLSAAATDDEKPQQVEFSLVTNRLIAASIKKTLTAIRAGNEDKSRTKFERCIDLKGKRLQAFCEALLISDREGDYLVQRETLHTELGRYFTGSAEENEVEGVVALVAGRALPNSDGKILPENVLYKLGVGHPRQLFPAPAQLDKFDDPFVREQQNALLASILTAEQAIIIHAAGGVGKSVVARQLVRALPNGSWGLVYDCFGSGNYRNMSQSRHRPNDALVQMANEMAVAGLCGVLVPRSNDSPKDIFLAFLERLRQSTNTLRTACPDAKLVLFIDAADNAEMAAAEAGGDTCFARALLREHMPEGCRLVALCRTERIHLLDPAPHVANFSLQPFSMAETGEHLRRKFPMASQEDVQEFHRLSGANPRVQASVLAVAHNTVASLLASLGPSGMTSDQQIAAQLDAAIAKLKDAHPKIYRDQIEAICSGLANLPPFIPLNILAAAARVDEDAIRSFVSDLGYSLWLSDHAVQFRDEPTETWFSQRFRAEPARICEYIRALEPLALRSAYVARSLPQLLHRVGDHDRLIALALSDESLPEDSPIDARDIRLYRLQFAFRAALQLGRHADACRLAFRSGEEVAGDVRQGELLADHVDLVPSLQSPHRVQELAYRRILEPSEWHGSANVHSAVLLSGVGDFKGEARSYLRGAERWLELTVGKRAESEFQHEQPSKEDFLAFAWTHCNLAGPQGAAEFFMRWKPSTFVFGVARMFTRRLVDANCFDELVGVAKTGAKQINLLLAAVDELLPFGKLLPKSVVNRGLATLAHESFQLEKMTPYSSEEQIVPAVLSLCEAAAARSVPANQILPVLDKFTSFLADSGVAIPHDPTSRRIFLRSSALRALLAGSGEPIPDPLLPKQEHGSNRDRRSDSVEKELKETLSALLPWYYLRALLLVQDPSAKSVDLERLRDRAKTALHGRFLTHDHLRYEMSSIHFEVLALKKSVEPQDLSYFDKRVLAKAEEKFGLQDRLRALRLAARLPHLSPLRDALENSARRTIEGSTEDGPEERSRWYIGLTRAVFADSQADARAYFDLAVEAVSKFGDEINERWSAVIAVASRAAMTGVPNPALAYRLIRCGEVVGRSIGKEKYWDRNEVFRNAAHLHLPTAFAGLSRWRDRKVGRFEHQLRALAGEAVKNGLITPACAWGFTGFLGCNAVADYASACIEKETDMTNRRRMLSAAIRDLELEEAGVGEFEKLMALFNGFEEEKERLIRIISAKAAGGSHKKPASFHSREETKDDSDELLRGVDVLDTSAFSRAVLGARPHSFERNFDSFWDMVLLAVPRGQEAKFLDTLLVTENLDYNDAGSVIFRIRDQWLSKPSVKRCWKLFLTGLGERFAQEIADSRRLALWGEQWAASADESDAVTKGMIKGLAGLVEVSDASTFFGFIAGIANRLTPQECTELLDFALSRLEIHIPDDFGDGVWSERLDVKEDTHGAMAGLVWSALGSPYSSTRWEAAHCVRRWAELGCTEPIGALIGWMKQDAVGAYAGGSYPFYYLHARLYLLIALARVSVDQAELLSAHSRVFTDMALEGLPHVLIQKNAADIALRIERAVPGTYEPEIIDQLTQVGKSRFAVVPEQPPRGGSGSPGWKNAESCAPFEQEFEWYWFDQISDIFGVSKKEAIKVARSIALKQFGINADDEYLRDPRQEQWNSAGHRDTGISHSHGSYPQNDTDRFYVSYHSFVSAASILLQRKPVVSDPDGWHDGDRWADWLRRHSLTRKDGRWLADRRDPAPTRRRPWVQVPPKGEWEKSVRSKDFVEILTDTRDLDGFLCVHGTWSEHVEYRTEDLWVHSALVSPATAESLASSLRSAEDSQHFFLPTYKHRDGEYSKGLFELTGWIAQRNGGDPRLDRFDPHAKNIEYPSLGVGSSFATTLGLSSDVEGRKWWQNNDPTTPVAVSEVWSSERTGERDGPCRSGQRIRVSVDLLKQLCRQSGKSLIFCVEIKRTMHHSMRPGANVSSYVPRDFKIFLFSCDGILRDKQKSHRVG